MRTHPAAGIGFDDVRARKPFLDGLRAIAIITVVASHVGLPGFAGGYVGVDIFFVISGYLIIGQIIADLDDGRFSILSFFARRALRILPAFLLVMASCLLLVTCAFIEPEYKTFAESFFMSALMLANHYFLVHQGYFDMAAFTKPLLHLWSLSVEEQFYAVAPVILLGMHWLIRGLPPANAWWRSAVVVAGLALVSLTICVVYTYGGRNVAFYIMPARGWEFILGGAAPCLLPLLRRSPRWINDAVAAAGMVTIAVAVVTLDADTAYPSYWAAAPAFGAALVIASGLADPRNPTARVLATAPFVGVGLVSYAWYLWHWPLLSFLRTSNFGDHDLGKALGVAALSFLLAVVTYRTIEVPIRAWRQHRRPRPLPVTLAGICACLAVGSIGFSWSSYAAPHLLPSIAGLQPVAVTSTQYPPVTQRGLLLGDSHASVLGTVLDDYARRSGAALTLKFGWGCPPLLHVAVNDHLGQHWNECDRLYDASAFTGSDFVILTARWNFYLGLPPSDPFFKSYLLVDQRSSAAPSDPYALLARGLTATIAAAKNAGVQRLLLIAPLPEFAAHPPYCLTRTIRLGVDGCAVDRAAVEARRSQTMQVLRTVAAGFERVRLIDPLEPFCTPTQCRPYVGRTLYFKDSNHLSPAGLARFTQAFDADLQWALTGKQPETPVASTARNAQ